MQFLQNFLSPDNIVAVLVVPILLNIVFGYMSQISTQRQLDDLQKAIEHLLADNVEFRTEIFLSKVSESEDLSSNVDSALKKIEALTPPWERNAIRNGKILRVARYYLLYFAAIALLTGAALVTQLGIMFIPVLYAILMLIGSIFNLPTVLANAEERTIKRLVNNKKPSVRKGIGEMTLTNSVILKLIPEVRSRPLPVGSDFVAQLLDEKRQKQRA